MKKLMFFCVFFSLISQITYGQEITPEKIGFKSFSIQDSSLGTVNYYVTANKIEEKKPVLLYLDGSGPYPLFQKTEQGIGSTVILDFKSLSNDYHIVLISKPGVPFFDVVERDSQTGYPKYQEPIEYKNKLSLDWRVNAAKLVLKQVINELKVNISKVALIGISEGFQVGTKLANEDKSITHLIIGIGNGLNQFYDFIIQNRIDEQSGVITSEQAQKNIDSLISIAKEIYAKPKETKKDWYGHTYLRWSSFTNNNPTDNILSLNIPVYIIAASKDRNSSVLGTDYLYLESIRNGKNNIVYKVYPYDHSLNEYVKDENGKIITVNNHMQEIYNDALIWLNLQ